MKIRGKMKKKWLMRSFMNFLFLSPRNILVCVGNGPKPLCLNRPRLWKMLHPSKTVSCTTNKCLLWVCDCPAGERKEGGNGERKLAASALMPASPLSICCDCQHIPVHNRWLPRWLCLWSWDCSLSGTLKLHISKFHFSITGSWFRLCRTAEVSADISIWCSMRVRRLRMGGVRAFGTLLLTQVFFYISSHQRFFLGCSFDLFWLCLCIDNCH